MSNFTTINWLGLIGSPVTYHGSITEAHGHAIVDDWCRCNSCADYRNEDHYELLLSSGMVLNHVSRDAFTKR